MAVTLMAACDGGSGEAQHGEAHESTAALTPGEIPRYRVGHHHADTGDWLPDYAAIATVRVDQQLVTQAGGTGASITWSKLRQRVALNPQDVVLVTPGITVIYDQISDAPITALVVQGTLRFAGDRSTRLRVGTLLVDGGTGRPGPGTLTIYTPDPRNTTEIVFEGTVDTAKDPAQFSLGLLSSGGTVDIRGARVAGHRGKVTGTTTTGGVTRVTVAGTFGYVPVGGAASGAGWPEQRIYLSDAQPRVTNTRGGPCGEYTQGTACRFPQEGELARVTNVQTTYQNGVPSTTLTLAAPLSFAHVDGYAGFLTRNVTFRSANRDVLMSRGHVAFAGSTAVRIDGAAFDELGRTTTAQLHDTQFDALGEVVVRNGERVVGTNQRGRYALHLHHLSVPFSVKNVSMFVDPSPGPGRDFSDDVRWGLAQHDTHGDVENSVCAGEFGSCFVSEQGNETGAWRGNLAIGTGGGSLAFQPHTREALPVEGQPGVRLEDTGHVGYAYWMRGPMIAVGGDTAREGNIAAGVFGVGFSYDLALGGPQTAASTEHLEQLAAPGNYYEYVLGKATNGVIPIAGIRNHLFKNNVGDAITLRGGVLELWYAQLPPEDAYSIELATLLLRGRGGGVSNRSALFALYSSVAVHRSDIRCTASDPNVVDYQQTTGIGNNGAFNQYVSVEDSFVKGCNVGVAAARTGGDFARLELKNEVNVRVGMESDLYADTLGVSGQERLPWTRAVNIRQATFFELYPGASTQRNVSAATVTDTRFADYQFLALFEPTLTRLTGSRRCDAMGCVPIPDYTIYDAQQDPAYVPFDGTWGMRQLPNAAGTLTPLAGKTNQQLSDTFGLTRLGVMMPCSPVNSGGESCTYANGGQVTRGALDRIEGYVDTRIPALPFALRRGYPLYWGDRGAVMYAVCSDVDGDGLLACGGTVAVAPNSGRTCYYQVDGTIANPAVDCRADAGLFPSGGQGPNEFYLDRIGTYAITTSINVNGSVVPRTFFVDRRN